MTESDSSTIGSFRLRPRCDPRPFDHRPLAAVFTGSRTQVFHRCRKDTDDIARAAAAYLGRRSFGYDATAVALGYRGPNSVSHAVRRVETGPGTLQRAVRELEANLG